MSQASAQFEDLLGDSLATSQAASSSTSAFYQRTSDSAYGNNTNNINASTIYTWADVLSNSLLSGTNYNSAYCLQLALAANDKAGTGTGNGSTATDPLGQGTTVLNGRWSTFVEAGTLGTNGYARVPLYSSSIGSMGGLIFANGTSSTAGEDQDQAYSNSSTWTFNTAGEWKNIIDVSFPASTGAWNSGGDIDYAVIMLSDEATDSGSGSFIPLLALELSSPVQVSGSGTTVTFSTGNLKYTLA